MPQCHYSGKSSYPTAADAWRVIRLRTGKKALINHKSTGKPNGYAYKCGQCHEWHITSATRRHATHDWERKRRQIREALSLKQAEFST